jgi:hypothetical protein
LTLRQNRTVQAWWIWLPLVFLIGLNHGAQPWMGFIPAEAVTLVGWTLDALAVGVASLWLLAAYLPQGIRLLVFLKMLVVVAGVAAFGLLIRIDWENPVEAVWFLVFLGLCSLVLTGGLALGGWLCRSRYRPAGLLLWLAVWMSLLWLIVLGPVILITLMIDGGVGPGWHALASAVLALTGLTGLLLLPFLLLAFANPFYRERLMNLLHLKRDAPPPLPVPSPSNVWETP